MIPLALACFALSPQVRAVCQDACLGSNTVQGDDAFISNTTGLGDTAMGFLALLSNTTGSNNTAIGDRALQSNTTGLNNTATGNAALIVNTTGFDNTATGDAALWTNNGSDNTATGANALYFNRSGLNNTASGSFALWLNIAGSNNTAMGANALGGNLGSNNIGLGYSAGVHLIGSNNIDVGNEGVAEDSGFIRIGTEGTHTATFVAGIRETPITGAIAVGINANGQLGVRASSARFKEAIKPMDEASEAILALKPVTFRYKKKLDPEGIPQFGLVAEEVEKVNRDLVARDEEGKPYSVRYEAVNAMLLNEFIKEHGTVQEQEATIAQLKSAVAKQEATAARQQRQIDALTAGLQKVSAQVEVSKSPPQTVLNNQ